MSALKTVIVNYCVYAFFAAVLELITSEKHKRAFRSFSFCVILAFSLLPLSGAQIDISNAFNYEEQGGENAAASLASACTRLERAVYENVSQALINIGINEYEIYVSTVVNEEECVVRVTEVLVELGEKFADDTERAFEALKADYEEILKVEVKNSGKR